MSLQVSNPFSPGPAVAPPHLAGRGWLQQSLGSQLEDVAAGRGHQSALLVGQRGMGKTVMLNDLVGRARQRGWAAIRLEVRADVPLAYSFADNLAALYEQLPGRVGHLPRWLREWDLSVALRPPGAEIRAGRRPEADGTRDFPPMLAELARVAGRRRGTGVLLAIDELHQITGSDLRGLGSSIQTINSERWPVLVATAGLPAIRERIVDEAPTYATRFLFLAVDALSTADTKAAFFVPASDAGVDIEPIALERLSALSAGYPFFVQLYGRHAWQAADAGTITLAHVETAHLAAMGELDTGVYGTAWRRLRPSEQRLLLYIAADDRAQVPIAEVAARMDRSTKSLSAARQGLIGSGIVEPAGHGLLRFAWPGFGRYAQFKQG